MILLRRELGDVLREQRQDAGRTLREVSASASVSLGYLSEVERGEKEPSPSCSPRSGRAPPPPCRRCSARCRSASPSRGADRAGLPAAACLGHGLRLRRLTRSTLVSGPEQRLVVLVDHDPRWALDYAADRRDLEAVLGRSVAGVDHVGSTSVPGLPAKPIIDILLQVARLGRRVVLPPCDARPRLPRAGP